MDEYFTRCMDEIEENKDRIQEQDEGPDKRTLEFLRLYARAYRAENNLAPELRGYVIN